MSETYAGPAMDAYRHGVMERLRAGEAVREVQDDIDGLAELSEDQRAALWLFAFAKRDPGRSERASRARVCLTS